MLRIIKLEFYKQSRYLLFWSVILLTTSIIALFYFRLCVDHLQLAVHQVANRDQANLSFDVIKPLCSWVMIIFALVFPLLTTVSISQELHQKSFYLYSSVGARDFVLGKAAHLVIILFIFIALFFVMLCTLQLDIHLNFPLILLSLLAILLVGSSIICFGLFISSCFSSPIFALLTTYIANILWILLEWLNPFGQTLSFLGKHLSLFAHSEYLLNGIIFSQDILYYLLFNAFWLFTTIQLINHRMKNYR